jgi:hypothetical protein
MGHTGNCMAFFCFNGLCIIPEYEWILFKPPFNLLVKFTKYFKNGFLCTEL